MTGNYSSGGIHSVFAAIRTVPVPLHEAAMGASYSKPPFITISREGGAGGRSIGQQLVERLNKIDPGTIPWTLWDKELVEKVASDHHLEKELVASLGEGGRSWMQDFLAGLSSDIDATETRIYQGVATTIRALAHQGRVVIVGRGGVYITRNIPNGIHLRLVAPFEHRAQFMARQLKLSYDAAAEHVRQLDHARQAFYRRYWPREVLDHESFTLTLNTAMIDEQCAVECVLPLVKQVLRKARTQTATEPSLAGV